jgi:RHS repeat-associated protein
MSRLSRSSHSFNIRFISVMALCYLLAFPPFWIASYGGAATTLKAAASSGSATPLPSRKTGSAESRAKIGGDGHTNVIRVLEPPLAIQSFGIVLTPVNSPFNGKIGISHHQPTNKVLSSTFYPSGQPHNFELVAADGTQTGFSNVAGISGELRIATARDDGQGMSLGGFTPGEVFTGTSVPGVIARITADGSSIQNPWVILPDESGLLNGGLHLDRTGVFGGDLIAVTTVGRVWRISASGQATQIANLDTRLEGVTVVPNDPDRYGPWAGKILTGAKEQGLVYAIDPQGVTTSYQFGINPEDITVIPAHENFYGVDPGEQKIWGAPANAFSSIIGDVLIAQESPGTLSRVHWNGIEFEVSQIAQVTQWKQITFSPAGIAPIPPVRQIYDRIAVVRHAPAIDSGRVEGAVWQLTGEATTLDGTDVITSDLLVPGTPTVTVSGSPNFEGTIQGTENAQPAGYAVAISGNATLRHLITRTDPIQLETVAAPPAPAGTRDVTLNNAGQNAGDWTTLRNLTLSGRAGAVTVPPGTYGAFASGSHNAFVFGVANLTQPTVYNLESLSLTGGSQLILNGPIILTVKNTVTLVGSTIGAADNPRQLLLKVSSNNTEAVKVSGTSVLYGIVRAPQGTVTIEGRGRLRGTVSSDRLVVNGAGILQITDSDIPPPPINRPPTVDAGGAQTITLPTNTVNLNGSASDDGLPQGSTLSVSWSKVSGPGTIAFSQATNTSTDATFSVAGTYVLKLTASDTELTSSDTVTITVLPSNQPPTVNAGPDQIVTLPNSASLSGSVIDDGLPSGSTVTVLWSKTSGPGSVVFGNPNVAATTASFSAAGTYTLRLTADDTVLSANDEVVITVNAGSQPADMTLTLEPSLAGPNVVGTSQTMRATLKHLSGIPVAGVNVQFAVTGSNTAGGLVPTDSAGLASFVYQGANSGTDSVQATAELNGSALQSNAAQVTWVTPSMQVSTTTVYARFFTSNGSGAFTATPQQTPAFEQVFPTINFNPPAGTIPGAPPGVNFNSRPMLDVTTDLNGNYTGSIVAQGQGVQAGVGTLFNFNAVFTGTFIVAQAGDLTFRFFSDDGFILGIGNGATRVSGALNNPPADGLSPFERLPVLGAFNVPTAPVGNLVTVHFPTAGSYPYEIDYSECCAGELVLTMTTNANPGSGGSFSGVPPSEAIVLSPNSVADRPTGGQQTFNVTARNGAGAPLAGVPVLFSITGANAQTFGTNANSLGVASFTYTGTFPGTDTVEAGAVVAGRGIFSNRVTVKWTPTETPPPEQVLSPGQIGVPANGSTLTGVIPIKLGAGVTLVNGTVSYWPVSDPSDVHVLATNVQGGPGDVVATLDTTLLANDSYVIRLLSEPDPPFGPPPPPDLQSDLQFLTVGQSLDGESTADFGFIANSSGSTLQTNDEVVISEVMVTVIGEYKPGRITLSTTDFTIPVAGVPITVGRTYDSLERTHLGDFGHGWSLSVGNPRLEVNPAHDVTLTDPNTGRRVTFKFTPRLLSSFLGFFYVPTFVPESGVHGSLITDGCGILLRLGGRYTCALSGDLTFQPTAYQYTDAQGRAFIIGADGVLRSIKDLHGNLITFDPTGITSSAGGLNVPFERDSLGRITRISDPAGNAWRYEYDEARNLSTVRLPGITEPITYTYDPSHLYSSATDPRGNVAVTTTFYPDGRIASTTDAAGNTTGYEYDLSTRTTTVTNPDGGRVVFRYDVLGLLLSDTDALGRTTTYTYDSDRNPLSETNALGQVTRYTYDEDGNQTSVTDPQGNISRVAYNDFGGPATATDQLGNVRAVHYDANFSPISVSDSLGTIAAFTVDQQGNPLTFSDGNGAITRLSYDVYGNLLTRADPLDRTTTYTYDQMGRVLTVTDPRGKVTRNGYDTLGRLATVTDSLDGVTTYEYDANNNKTAQVDALGRRTTYTYDAANRLTRTTYPDNTAINYTYNFRDQKLTETDQAGRVTTYTYDLAGQLTRMKYADNAEVIHAYDAIGRETATTDERNNTTLYEYDPACTCRERIGKVTDALNHTTVYKFDVAGRLTSVIDAATRETKFTYDVRNRLTLVTYPDNTTALQSYDPAGHQLTETDQAGRLTRYSYDAAGELSSVTDALDQATNYSYDAARNLLSVIDANNHTTRYEYDSLNRLTKRTLPLGMSETLAYDAVGNRTSRTDFIGKRTTYSYDSLNRLLSKIPDATLSEPSVSFTYTATGQRATMVDASGTTTYTYNNRDRLTSKATPQGTLTYTYDAVGNPLSLRSSNANGASVNYGHDVLNRLQSVTDNRLTPGTTTYSYDAVDNLTAAVSANGVQSTLGYNALDNPTNLTISKGGLLRSYAYNYNAAGQRLSATENSGRAVSYSYDALARLTSETITNDPNSANGTLNYSLDAVGNRLSRTSTLAAISSTTSTYDANDRLNSDSYNANGNTTSADGNTYAYNFENRIKTVDGGATTFVYDGDGNRVAKTAAGVTTKYLVDDLNPTGYAQVTEEVAGGSVQRTYTYGNALVSQKQLGNSQTSFYGSDAHGSVRLLTNNAGSVTDAYDYEAFGNLVSGTGATPNDYLYSGERFDSDLGAYHLRERYYSPQRGRFLTSDPFAGFTDLPRTLQKYLYVGADPVNYIDPSGLTETTEYKLRGTIQPKLKIPCSILKIKDLLNVDPALLIAAEAVELVICGCQPAKGTSVGQNYTAGKQLERDIAQTFGNLGYHVTPNEYVRVPGHARGRFIDVVVRRGTDIVIAIEAKVGRSPYRGAQRAKDVILRNGGLPLAVVRRLCR